MYKVNKAIDHKRIQGREDTYKRILNAIARLARFLGLKGRFGFWEWVTFLLEGKEL